MDFQRLSRRDFLKKTSVLTIGASSLSLFTGLVNATEHNYDQPGWTTVEYCFDVTATPDETNPDQVESIGGARNEYANMKIPADGSQGNNCLYRGPWDTGIGEYYGEYYFIASGPTKGLTLAISIGGEVAGKLWEKDILFDDLVAAAEVTMSPRTWTIDPDTGVVSEPSEILELPQDASPGSGSATATVSLAEFIGRVQFNYSYVSSWSAALGITGDGGSGEGGATYDAADSGETVFGFLWRVKILKVTRTYNGQGQLVSTVSSYLPLP